jgi:dehydrogenase
MLSSVVSSVNGKWEVKEVPTPQASTNQVLIKIHASGICYTEVHITKGEIGVKLPYTIGHEPAGEIVALDEGMTTRKVGDRVGVPWVQSTCGSTSMAFRLYRTNGVYQESELYFLLCCC